MGRGVGDLKTDVMPMALRGDLRIHVSAKSIGTELSIKIRRQLPEMVNGKTGYGGVGDDSHTV